MSVIEAKNLAKIYGREENRVEDLAGASLRVEGLEGGERGLQSPTRIVLTTHRWSPHRPMMQPVPAGTLSIAALQRRSNS